MSELAKVLDKKGHALDYGRPIREIHADPNLLCETVHIWIYDPKGFVLLQKRSKNHSSDPGVWDISAAGHVDFGEEPKAAAIREVKEELGLKINPSALNFKDRRYVEHSAKSTYPGLPDYIHNEYVVFYFLELDKETTKINLEDGEVDKFEWLPVEVFESEINKPNQNKYVRFDPSYYQYVIYQLKNLIGETETN